jgi:hypothetical protein
MAGFAGLLLGALFGVGLALSGMTQPAKVLAFLDVTGAWDASLAFVMAGAIGVYAPLYRFLVRATQPVYVREFVVAVGGRIDGRLLLGAAVFGVGWGLGGYCPGPALVSAGTGTRSSVVFTLAMIAGMLLFEVADRIVVHARARRGAPAPNTR